MTTTFVQYAPRRIEWLGVESVQGTLLKRYAVTCGNERLDRTRFDAGLPLVTSALPPRVGVGWRHVAPGTRRRIGLRVGLGNHLVRTAGVD